MELVREADLDAWLARLAGGDRSAFEPLYLALRPRALRLARTRLGSGDAEDVAQTALLKVFSRASEFTPGRPCLPWFYAIVANEIQATRRRTRSAANAGPVPSDLPNDEADAETQMVMREMERALETAIESLDDDAARAIHAMLDRATPPKMSAATFRKRVSRAYAKLRMMLGGHDVG